jgi:hypothetical protein
MCCEFPIPTSCLPPSANGKNIYDISASASIVCRHPQQLKIYELFVGPRAVSARNVRFTPQRFGEKGEKSGKCGFKCNFEVRSCGKMRKLKGMKLSRFTNVFPLKIPQSHVNSTLSHLFSTCRDYFELHKLPYITSNHWFWQARAK